MEKIDIVKLKLQAIGYKVKTVCDDIVVSKHGDKYKLYKITNTGKLKVSQEFDDINTYDNVSMIVISIDGKSGILNTDLDYLIAPVYDNIQLVFESIIILSLNDSYSILNIKLEEITNMTLGKIHSINKIGDTVQVNVFNSEYKINKLLLGWENGLMVKLSN